jgi:predicted nuclease of restriction endonuclease-like (RecB) superfamily
MPRKKSTPTRQKLSYEAVLADVMEMIETARRASARTTNAIITATYWNVGRRIVEQEQHGKERAEYGTALIERLAADLTERFGRGFGRRNLFQMRSFYLAYREIVQTAPAQSSRLREPEKVQTASALSGALLPADMAEAPTFPLPWSHYVRLMAVKNPEARRFYESEALRGGWTIRQLDRQIGTQFYERTALSRNKAAMLRRGQTSTPATR